ncbi:MAG: TRAP transporter small permease [Pirellulaceae bacterium]|nr:TRAP transporter small permease [Pirellulaceae bacterium]
MNQPSEPRANPHDPNDTRLGSQLSGNRTAVADDQIKRAGMAKQLRRVTQIVMDVERWLATTMLGVLLIVMGSQVIARYMFRAPFSWSEEAARLSMIWLTFLAASRVMAEGRHITVDLWSSRLRQNARQWWDALACIVVAATCGALCVGGLRFVWYVHPVASPALGIPKSIWYGALSVGLLLMTLHNILNLVWLSCVRQPLDQLGASADRSSRDRQISATVDIQTRTDIHTRTTGAKPT